MAGRKLLTQAGLDDVSRRRRLAYLDFRSEDEERIAGIRHHVAANVDGMVDAFYAYLARFEDTRPILGDLEQIDRLKTLLRDYFLRMTDGRFDADYFESRLRVGAAHARIDLRPEWYLGAYSLYFRLLTDGLRDQYRDRPEELIAIIESVGKLIFLDMGLAIDAYIMSGYVDRTLAHEYRRMAEVAERTLREKADLEQMKADLTSMIVHDLKGPLGGILTVAQLALRKRGNLGPDHVRQLEQIQRSARDLMRMIENLLEIDQMQEGRLDLRLEPVDVGTLLAECAEEFRAAAETVGQTIAVTVGEEVPGLVSDRWLLRRVLNNLVVNAIRHSGSAGRIDLEARSGSGGVEIRVRDAGRGIPVEEQATLFLKDSSTASRRHRDDTGLGLVFCKMAVETMGGTIDVVSAPGAGATFTVRIPSAVER